MRFVAAVCLFLSLMSSWSLSALGAATSAKPRPQMQAKKPPALSFSDDPAQQAFFEFVFELYKFAQQFANKRKSYNEPFLELYTRIDKGMQDRFFQKYKDAKPVLRELSVNDTLHIVKDTEIVPKPIYEFMQRRFAIRKDPTGKSEGIGVLTPKTLLLRTIGGDFNFGDDGKTKLDGFLEFIEKFDMNAWGPVDRFIRNFNYTLTADGTGRLSATIGKTLKPMVLHYYKYMDIVSRFRILKEILADVKIIPFKEKKHTENTDLLSVRVFLYSGPVMIKLLQQLHEAVGKKSPMSKVLEGLDTDSKPMPPADVEERTWKEVQRLTHANDRDRFKFNKERLGAASIAEAHFFSFRDRKYVVKVQHETVAGVFKRESEFLERMVATEKKFDKGMKGKIANTNAGIVEEVNFNFERRNIELGAQAYTNPAKKIATIVVPELFKEKDDKGRANIKEISDKGSPTILVMSLAPGESLTKIIDRADPEDIKKLYIAVQMLYEEFLFNALDHRKPFNFYHGDLHRGNIFFDLKTLFLTLIDFGNAGILDKDMRNSIMNIFSQAKATSVRDDTANNAAILALGKVLRDFVLAQNATRIKESPRTKSLIDTYFRVCFNPANTLGQRDFAVEELTKAKRELEGAKEQLTLILKNGNSGISPRKLDVINDDIDFIKALVGNCLSGPVDTLNSTLGSQAPTSDKLDTVFQELLKNGIAMPYEVIFFNKSKSLLEDILSTLSRMLVDTDYQHVEPDTIYDRVVADINRDLERLRTPAKEAAAPAKVQAAPGKKAS